MTAKVYSIPLGRHLTPAEAEKVRRQLVAERDANDVRRAAQLLSSPDVAAQMEAAWRVLETRNAELEMEIALAERRAGPVATPAVAGPIDSRRIDAYLAKMPTGLHDGEGRNGHAVRIAAWLTHDAGLTTEAARPYLERWNAQQAEAYDAAKLTELLTNGAKYGTRDVGAAGPDRVHIPSAEPQQARSLAAILQNPDALKPPAAVIPGLAWRGRITLVAAREGVGKSTLFSAAAAAVTTGSDFLGERCAKGTVLWTLSEEHLSDFVIRALRFQSARGDELQVLERPADPIASLEAEVDRLKPTLLVLDTLHAFAATLVKDKSQSDDWLTLMARLDRIARSSNVAILMAAQAQKGNGEYRDSGSIGHGVDVVLNLVRPDKNSSIRILERQKARWDLPDLHVELTPEGYRRTTPKAASDTRRHQILDALTTAWQTAAQVAAQVGRPERVVRGELNTLFEAGTAEREGTGRKGDGFRFRIPDPAPYWARGVSGMNPDSGDSGDSGIDQHPESLPF